MISNLTRSRGDNDVQFVKLCIITRKSLKISSNNCYAEDDRAHWKLDCDNVALDSLYLGD